MAPRELAFGSLLQLLSEDRAIVLQPLVIHREVLDREGLDDAGGPLSELDRPLGVDLVANSDDGREVVVAHGV
jgi:hypothetical protein